MKKLALALTAISMFSYGAAFADEKTEKTETHDTDGKSTTKTKKVKHKADGKGNSEVKTETTEKTEVKK
ncbi:MAG: hypothetical protein JWN44_654 [Myxococcales bacterium]|nr:hypothetical protein [Myxococcales bacterium]